MSAKSTQDYYAKIQIASSSTGTPREIKLSRIQFEVLFLSIPVVLIWGIASTVILIRTLYLSPPQSELTSRRTELAPETQTVLEQHPAPAMSQRKRVDAAITTEPTEIATPIQQSQPSLATMPRTNSRDSATVLVASRAFQVEDLFGIDLKIIAEQERGSFTVDVDMTNMKGLEESGTFWISLQAVTETGDKIWVTPMPDVDIDASGQAELPQLGERFSFRTLRKSKLKLDTSREDILKFDQVMIGFNRNNNSPTIAKVNLNSR